MDTPRALCPNCDHYLSDYRAERQSAQQREIILYWMICARCRHVALHDWAFTDEIPSVTPADLVSDSYNAG